MSKKGAGAAAAVTGLLAMPVNAERAALLAEAMGEAAKRKRRARPYFGELAGPPCKSNDARVRRYRMLFEHFGLQLWDFPALAVALAMTHVPGLQLGEPAKKGRPRKVRPVQVTNLGLSGTSTSATFGPGLLGSHFAAKSKGGAPRKVSPEARAYLLAERERWIAEQRESGAKRINDSAFAWYFCVRHYPDWKQRTRQSRERAHRRIKVEISRTKKSVTKPAK